MGTHTSALVDLDPPTADKKRDLHPVGQASIHIIPQEGMDAETGQGPDPTRGDTTHATPSLRPEGSDSGPGPGPGRNQEADAKLWKPTWLKYLDN
jgi:hypothetical protein